MLQQDPSPPGVGHLAGAEPSDSLPWRELGVRPCSQPWGACITLESSELGAEDRLIYRVGRLLWISRGELRGLPVLLALDSMCNLRRTKELPVEGDLNSD